MYYRILESWGRWKHTASICSMLAPVAVLEVRRWAQWGFLCAQSWVSGNTVHWLHFMYFWQMMSIFCLNMLLGPLWKFVRKLLLPLILSSNVIIGMLVNGYQPAQGRECWFVVFASFHCVNTHTLANVKSLMKRHWAQDWEELHTVGSLVLIMSGFCHHWAPY